MSKVEDSFEKKLIIRGIEFEKQKPIPIYDCPWKSDKSKLSKSDYYIPKLDLYIEVKGFMTLDSMFKIYYFMSRKEINYILYQGTEFEFINWKNTDLLNYSESSLLKSSKDLQLFLIESAYKGKYKVDDLCISSCKWLQNFVKRWKEKYKFNNLNLLDFLEIQDAVDFPEAGQELYRNITRDSNWLYHYPNNDEIYDIDYNIEYNKD